MLSRSLAIALVLASLVAVVLHAQTARYYQTQTVDNTTTYPVCTNASTPANCAADVATTSAYCTVETNPVRWLATGTPTTTVGHLAQAGTSISLAGHANLANFKVIATTASAATLTCEIGRP